MMEYKNGLVAIHPNFNKLITSLRTGAEKSEGMLEMLMASSFLLAVKDECV
jgi:hypothetical protein